MLHTNGGACAAYGPIRYLDDAFSVFGNVKIFAFPTV